MSLFLLSAFWLQCSACCCSDLCSCTAEAFRSAVSERWLVVVCVCRTWVHFNMPNDGTGWWMTGNVLIPRNWQFSGFTRRCILVSSPTPSLSLSSLMTPCPLSSSLLRFSLYIILLSPILPPSPPFCSPLLRVATLWLPASASLCQLVKAATGGCRILQRSLCVCVRVCV